MHRDASLPAEAGKPDVFTYLDYRKFLCDAFLFLQRASPRLSYRGFARQAGFTSPNFLQQVIEGGRNLGSANLLATARAFKLGKLETEFFQLLVGYEQARTNAEKDAYYQKIIRNKRFGSTKVLERRQYEFFSHWYIPVVRELLTHKDCGGESAWIAERIFPRISLSQVEGAKKLLQEMDLVRWDESTGSWRQTDASVRTDSEAAHLALRNYHMSVIQLAHDSMKNFPAPERDIRSITVGLTKSGFEDLKARMENIWKDLLDFAGTQSETEKVYQVNLQLFPLVRERRK